jgi:RimJ/RimL family protein N-acetyltransferase
MVKQKIEFFYQFDNRYLFPLEKKFLPKLKEWRNAQARVLRQFKPLTDFHQKRWYSHLKEDKNQVLFAIMAGNSLKKLDFIGYSGIVNIDYKNRRGELSFLVNPARVKKREVYKKDFFANLNMLCRYGFDEINLNKLYSETFEFRKDHIKMLKEFGFHTDGILRHHHFTGGKYYNSFIQSILFSEWKQKF